MTLAMWPLNLFCTEGGSFLVHMEQWDAPAGMGIGVALSPQNPIGDGAGGVPGRAGDSQQFESHVAMAIRSAPGK